MCYGILQYQCSHSARARINCRQTWRKRTGWFCYPIVRLICGPGPEQPCDEIRPDKYWWVANSCKECRKAEENDSNTKGRIHDRYRSRLTHDELQRSRRRVEEERRLEEMERNMYRDDRIKYQQMKRAAKEEARNKGNGNNSNTAAATDNNNNTALPIMPSFAHVPLGNRYGQAGYHQPSQIANSHAPPPALDKPLPVLPEDPQDEDRQDEPVVKDKKQWWKHLPPAEDIRALQSGRIPGHDGAQGKQTDDGRNPYRPYENEIASRNLTQPRLNRETPSSSSAQRSPPIADRRGKPLEPLKDPRSSQQTPVKAPGKTPERKGLKRLLSSATRSDSRSEARTESMASESSSFVCQDSRAVERGY
ncbi:hypothetical protein CPLU01_02928 [Colletotrichum plurivorum]|uniref:Uncharacterized protein n=1 Tax=Colletotrichum plurivorum TaxID=2175906 RepID=A0A8H6NM11_9PEZI|nr:hypothetical protein CPLU01_02928 [Colletotrichum plurivorum]